MHPGELVPIIAEWVNSKNEPHYALPSSDLLEQLVEVAFHASLLTEEGRRFGFRVALVSQESIDRGRRVGDFVDRLDQAIQFQSPRAYSVSEINKLAPTAHPSHVLIAAWHSEGVLHIWGLLDAGLRLERTESRPIGSTYAALPVLTVAARAPGELSVSWGDEVIATLRLGKLSEPYNDAFSDGALAEFFQPTLASLWQQLKERIVFDDPGDSWQNYTRFLYHQFYSRLLHHIQQKRHGGSVLIVRAKLARQDTRITDRLRIKYPSDCDRLWSALLHLCTKKIERERLRRTEDVETELAELRRIATEDLLGDGPDGLAEHIYYLTRLFAGLSAVDGAVVLSDRLSLLGFGAEVIVPSPTLTTVKVRSRSGTRRASLEDFGTRHRAAFRFCSSMEDCIALVVSQDGEAKAVKRVEDEIVVWSDIGRIRTVWGGLT